MKKPSTRTAALILALLMVLTATAFSLSLTGCSSQDNASETPAPNDNTNADNSEKTNETADADNAASNGDGDAENNGENNGNSSENGNGGEKRDGSKEYVVLEGKQYALPVSFSELSADGWTFNEEEWINQFSENMADAKREQLEYVPLKTAASNLSKTWDGPVGFYSPSGNTVRRINLYNSAVYWRSYDKCDVELSLYAAGSELSDGRTAVDFELTGGVTANSTFDDVLGFFKDGGGSAYYDVDTDGRKGIKVTPKAECNDVHFKYDFEFDADGAMLFASWSFYNIQEYNTDLTIRKPLSPNTNGIAEIYVVYHFEDALFSSQDLYIVFLSEEDARKFAADPVKISGLKPEDCIVHGCVIEAKDTDHHTYEKNDKIRVVAREILTDEDAPKENNKNNIYFNSTYIVVGEGSFTIYYNEMVTPLD